MDAAIFRSNGKNFVNFISIEISKPVFLRKSGVGQVWDILDFRQVTRSGIRLGPGQGPRLHFFNLASHSPHIVYQEYICQYLGDVHEISKILPPTSSNPNQYSISILETVGIWQFRVEYSTRIFSWHGTARFFRHGNSGIRHGTARHGTSLRIT